MLNVAMVCCSPPPFTATWIGWRMALIPTLSIASRRVSALAWTSGMPAARRETSGSRMFMRGDAFSEERRRMDRVYQVVRGRSGGPDRAHRRIIGEPLAKRREDAILIEASDCEQLVLVAVIDEMIRQAEVQHRHRESSRRDALCHRAAGPAHHNIVLDGDEERMRARELLDELAVERLHEAHVYD